MTTNHFTIFRQGLNPDYWSLLIRTVEAARLVRRHLPDQRISPDLASSIRAVDHLYLAPQPGWSIDRPRVIASAAHLIIKLPWRWGRCVQQSLITYRLLNGYGIPCRICYGVSISNQDKDGHAWIRTLNPADQQLTGGPEPLENFRIVYVSPLPPQNDRSKNTDFHKISAKDA